MQRCTGGGMMGGGSGWRTMVCVVGTLAVGTACSSDRVLPTAPTTVVACEVPSLLVDQEPVALEAAEIREALQFADLMLRPAIESGRGPLHRALVALSSDASLTPDIACRAMHDAVNALRAIPESPETAAERHGIEFALHFARRLTQR